MEATEKRWERWQNLAFQTNSVMTVHTCTPDYHEAASSLCLPNPPAPPTATVRINAPRSGLGCNNHMWSWRKGSLHAEWRQVCLHLPPAFCGHRFQTCAWQKDTARINHVVTQDYVTFIRAQGFSLFSKCTMLCQDIQKCKPVNWDKWGYFCSLAQHWH